MSGEELRKVELRRLARDIVSHLEDFPRQYAALETAMAAFGDDFNLGQFKTAFETSEDLEAYNRAQALERAVGRVQNYVADLAQAGANLARLPGGALGSGGSPAGQAFEALRDAKVINAALCRQLVRAQKARSSIEHTCVQIPAGDVHRAARLIHVAAGDFIGPYRAWVEPYLESLG